MEALFESPPTINPDPLERVGTTRTIAVTNAILGVTSLVYHIWSFVDVLKDSELIERTGQSDVVVYTGLVIMILIGIIICPVSWKLFQGVGTVRSAPNAAIKACRCWRRWIGTFLTFFVTSFMILVLSSAEKVHQGVVQNYMAGLLIICTFCIYGLYYVAKLINEIANFDPNLDPSAPPNPESIVIHLEQTRGQGHSQGQGGGHHNVGHVIENLQLNAPFYPHSNQN